MELSEKSAWHLLKSVMAVSSVSMTHAQVWQVILLRSQVSGTGGREDSLLHKSKKALLPHETSIPYPPQEKRDLWGFLTLLAS